MITRYLEYTELKEGATEVLNGGSNTMIVFSRLDEIFKMGKPEVETFYRIFSFLQEKTEEEMDDDYENISEEDEIREQLYGSFVDCFESEHYHSEDIEPRNLKVLQLAELPLNATVMGMPIVNDETFLAFGFINSSDMYLTPTNLKILQEDLTWFVSESGKAKDSTKLMVMNLVELIKKELEAIEKNKPHVNLFVAEL